MPIIPAWAQRDQVDADARFIAIAAAMRVYGEHAIFDVEKIRAYVGELAQNDMELIARAMSVAQWIVGRGRP